MIKGLFFSVITGVLCLAPMALKAQLSINIESRTRSEFREGYSTLFPNNTDPATFVSQRSRLNFKYQKDFYTIYTSVQDVRTWGDVAQLNTADKNALSLHEAWSELAVGKLVTAKFGRQELDYDDARILGNADWNQQARSHDAFLLKFAKDDFKVHLGAAYNQEKELVAGNNYTLSNYKALQYIWLHKNFKWLSASVLFLNNGIQAVSSVDPTKNIVVYSQTLGTHLEYTNKSFMASSNIYGQFGTDASKNKVSGLLASIDASYKFSPKFKANLGTEYLSGNDKMKPANGVNNAFTPLYGTNHKFNGLMDYFYVGNHANNVGLTDCYVIGTYAFSPKASLNATAHYFLSSAKIADGLSNNLGTEIDLVFEHKCSAEVNLKAGFSTLFAEQGLKVLKNNFDNNSNYWGWMMLTIKPKFMN